MPAMQAAIVSQLLNDAISNDHFQSIANDHELCLLLAYKAQMESKLSRTTESEAPKAVNQVVADVLAEKTRKNQFLRNVGIEVAQPTSSEQNGTVPDLQAENAELRSIINTQHRQIDDLTMKQAELEAKLELVLSQVRRS